MRPISVISLESHGNGVFATCGVQDETAAGQFWNWRPQFPTVGLQFTSPVREEVAGLGCREVGGQPLARVEADSQTGIFWVRRMRSPSACKSSGMSVR